MAPHSRPFPVRDDTGTASSARHLPGLSKWGLMWSRTSMYCCRSCRPASGLILVLVRGRDDAQVASAAGLVAGEVLGVGRGVDRAGGFADGVGQGDQVVGGGGWGCEVAVVA